MAAVTPEFMTALEVAKALRVSKMTVYRLIQEPGNPLGAITVGKHTYRIPVDGLRAYVDRAKKQRS